jgi:hypothetical protein
MTLIFPEQLEHRRTCGSHVGYKSRNVIQAAKKTSNVLLSFGRRHLLYYFYHGRINLNTLLTENKAQQLTITNTKSTLIGIQAEFILPQTLESLRQKLE